MLHIAGEDLTNWEAESAHNFLQVWEKIDSNSYKDLVALLNNPQDISTTLKAKKHFEKLLPDSHERLTGFFQSMDTDKEKVTNVLKKLLRARLADINTSAKEVEGQVNYDNVRYTIYNRGKKPLVEWYKETFKDKAKADSPTVTQVEGQLKQVDKTFIPSRTSSPNSSERRGEAKRQAESLALEEISVSEKPKHKGPK